MRKTIPSAAILASALFLAAALAVAAEPTKEPTAAEVEALIKAAETPPDWLAATPANPPATLKLDWQKRGQGWQPDLNLGAHMITRVYPSPDKWRYGVAVLHKALEVNANDANALKTTCNELGRMHCDFLGDFPRAAYWWRRSGADPVKMADCYRLMGAKSMALAELGKAPASPGVVKLRAELGDLPAALQTAQAGAGNPEFMLAAGNACRFAGDWPQARGFYQKVVDLKPDNRNARARERAAEALRCLQDFEKVDVAKVRDGAHTGSAKGFRGPVDVSVTVTGGKIAAAKVTRHADDWCGRSMTDIPAKIVAQGGIKGVDAVTRATISSDAVINAAAAALKAAGKQ